MLTSTVIVHVYLAAPLSSCDHYWWSNLLFINNLVPFQQGETRQCFYHTWYLVRKLVNATT
jgi:hypothetical protein